MSANTPVRERDYSQGERDAMPDDDFAGPGESFPIKTQADVHNAATLVGKAADPAAVKARIIAIAKRKGFTLPDAWQEGGEKPAQEAAVTMPAGNPLAMSHGPAAHGTGTDKGYQEHTHTHRHGAHTHSHLHCHEPAYAHDPNADGYGGMEHPDHTHCGQCGADDRMCGHGSEGGPPRLGAWDEHKGTGMVEQEEEQAKLKAAREANTMTLEQGTPITVRVHEATAPQQVQQISPDRRWGIVDLISVGPGNQKAGNYYTEQAVRDAARLSVGRRMYVSHPGSADRDRGHRDPLMMASVVKEAWFDAPSQSAQAKVRFLPTHAWLPAVLAEEPTAVQVSLDGAGQGHPGQVGGVKYRAVIEHMTRVDSADWVPEGGARGRFIRFTEAAGELSVEEQVEMLDNLTAEEIRENAPDLYAQVVELARSEGVLPAPRAASGLVDTEALIREATAPLYAEVERLQRERNMEQTETYIRESLSQAGLPPKALGYLAARFQGATVGERGKFKTKAELDEQLGAEVAAYRATLPTGMVTGLGGGMGVGILETAGGAGYTDPFRAADDMVAGMFGMPPLPREPQGQQAPQQANGHAPATAGGR